MKKLKMTRAKTEMWIYFSSKVCSFKIFSWQRTPVAQDKNMEIIIIHLSLSFASIFSLSFQLNLKSYFPSPFYFIFLSPTIILHLKYCNNFLTWHPPSILAPYFSQSNDSLKHKLRDITSLSQIHQWFLFILSKIQSCLG